MAHATSPLARIYDEINRDGFEWLMKPFTHYQRYLTQYEDKSPRLRFFRRFALSLLALPLLSVAYVFTRTTGVILNPGQWRDNPIKPTLMSFFGGISVALPMIALGVKNTLALASLGVPGVGGIVVAAGLLATLTAGVLYASKMLARSIEDSIDNEGDLIQAKGLSGKHRLLFFRGLEDFPGAYQSILAHHKTVKEMIPENRAAMIQNTRAIKRGKQFLADFEEVVEAHNQETLTQEQFHKLQNTEKTHFTQWQTSSKFIDDNRVYQRAIENKEVIRGKIVTKVHAAPL